MNEQDAYATVSMYHWPAGDGLHQAQIRSLLKFNNATIPSGIGLPILVVPKLRFRMKDWHWRTCYAYIRLKSVQQYHFKHGSETMK